MIQPARRQCDLERPTAVNPAGALDEKRRGQRDATRRGRSAGAGRGFDRRNLASDRFLLDDEIDPLVAYLKKI